MLLIQDLLDGEQLDESAGALVEGGALPLGVGRVTEGDVKAALAVFSLHHRAELVDQRAARLAAPGPRISPAAGRHAARRAPRLRRAAVRPIRHFQAIPPSPGAG